MIKPHAHHLHTRTRLLTRRAAVVAVTMTLFTAEIAGADSLSESPSAAVFSADPYVDAVVQEYAGMPVVADQPSVATTHQPTAAAAAPATMPPPIAPSGTAENAYGEGNIEKTRQILGSAEVRAAQEAIQQPKDIWDRIRAGFAMPDLRSKLVTQRQNEYARPHMIKTLVERSRKYLFHIVEEIEKRGMPMELALLPMVESAFNPMAYSRAHASGLWQFIPSTGRDYNLDQDWWYDARRDVVASTSAALEYLQKIYEMHGNWHLALASYNFGEWGVARSVERNRRVGLPMDFSNLRLPNETRHYVPRLQALKNIIANPERFGIELDPIPNAPYFTTVTISEDIDLDLAARLAEMPVDELIALNPGHNRPVVSSAKANTLVLPADQLETFIANLSAYDKPLSAWQIYEAKRGERLEEIAAKHNITVDQLRLVNSVRGSGRLQTNAQLLVPTEDGGAAPIAGLFKSPATISAEFVAQGDRHIVKRGETWQGIANLYRVRVQDLQASNGGGMLIAGKTLSIPRGSVPVRAAGSKSANGSRSSAPVVPAQKGTAPVNIANR